MPYIAQERRESLPQHFFSKLVDAPTPGDLNYLFTLIAKEYLADRGVLYRHFNDVIGALEGAKLELYRRMVAPYEDEAINRNGDVR